MNPVLSSLEPILKEPKHVFTDKAKIEELAPAIAKEELLLPQWREEVFIDRDDLRTIDFFMLGNTINFAYMDFESKKKFETEYKGKKYTGAYAMFACLKRAMEEGKSILAGDYLTLLERKDMERIFRGNIEMPMLDERLDIFHEVGNTLAEKYKNRFCNLVAASSSYAFNNGDGIVDKLVNEFPSFDDTSNFNGNKLLFYKRAQLAVATAYERLLNKGFSGFFDINDIDDLTVFADYTIPRSLKNLGIIKYEKNLEDKVLKQELIEKNSREEQEIRANTIYASDLLVKEINKYRDEKDNINALHIDYKLWASGRKVTEPHHLTKTIAY